MRFRFFLRLMRRSLTNRLGKWLTAVLAVAMGASLVSASLTLAVSMRAKMSQALRSYGANILLVPAAGLAAAAGGAGGAQLFASMSEDVLVRLAELGRDLPLVGYAPQLYAMAEIGSHRVALVGTWPDAIRQVNPSWRVEGGWIEDRTDAAQAIVGTSAAQKLGLTVGSPLTLSVQGRARTFRAIGILSTGGSEDEQVFVTLRAAQELTGRPGQLSLIQVSASAADSRPASSLRPELRPRGSGETVEDIARALESSLPGVAARTQLRLVMAEERLLARLSLLLNLVAALVLIASTLTVAADMATSVLERTREIGLMKALGASRSYVGRLFLVEAGLIGLAGGLLGGGIGLLLAQVIARTTFGGAVPLSPLPTFASIGVGVGVASVASLIPVRRAASTRPSSVLRGE